MFRQIDGKLCAVLSDVAAAFFVARPSDSPVNRSDAPPQSTEI